MTQVTIHQAKTHLSRLIQKALQGEEVVIAKRQQPLIRLDVIKPPKSKRRIGWARGLVARMSADFNASLPEFEEHMLTSSELRRRRARKKSK